MKRGSLDGEEKESWVGGRMGTMLYQVVMIEVGYKKRGMQEEEGLGRGGFELTKI